jgi:hypothetical protein
MIPEEKREAVTRALQGAFGVAAFEEIEMLTRGQTSALVYRIVVQGIPRLLRIIMREETTTHHHFTCMEAAAGAGLAPLVWYTSLEDRIAITDFIESVPFPADEARTRMPELLRKLHALPPFPGREAHLNTTATFLLKEDPAKEGLIGMVQGAKIVADSDLDELLARLARIVAVYPRYASDQVSSHNDLFKPDNILYDGERVWLVDWEAAFLNDRYADLAAVAIQVTTGDAEQCGYLETYFGQAPDEYQMTRLFLMELILHAFYAMVFLLQGSPGMPPDRGAEAPAPAGFYRRFWNGEFTLEEKPMKALFGRVHLEQFFGETSQPGFEEALRIVAERDAG